MKLISKQTEVKKLKDRIGYLLELPRTDNVQIILNRLGQELLDLDNEEFERSCYSF